MTHNHTVDPGTQRARLLAAAAVAVTVVLHATAAASARLPIWSDDEIGPLAMARLIAAVGKPLTLNHFAYYPGWAVVMAPLWWVSEDPATVYRLAVALAALSACLTMIPLAAIARRLGASGPVAVDLAALVMAAPSRVVMSDYAVIEAFFGLLVVVTAWLGLRYADKRTLGRGLALAFGASYAFFTHGRGLVLPIAVAILFVSELRRGGRRRALVLLLVLVASSLALFAVYRGLSAQLYDGAVDREDSSVGTVVDAISGPLLRGLVGQFWYTLVAWAMLPAFGVALLVREVRREWIAGRRVGAAAWWTLVVVGALAMGTLATTSLIESTPARLDSLMYGRYLDPFLLPLVLVALVGIARGLRRRAALGALATGAALLILFLLLGTPARQLGARWFPLNIAGLLLWNWPKEASHSMPPFALASLVAVAAGVLVVLAGRRGRWMAIGVIGALFVASSVRAQVAVVWPAQQLVHVPTAVSALARVDAALGERVPVVYLSGGAAYVGQNLTQYWLVPRPLPVLASDDSLRDDVLVVGRPTWAAGEALGARAVAGHRAGTDLLWVLPGPLADRLAALGLLADTTSSAPSS